MKLLIGITGKLGSGKDYITNNLVIPILKRQSLSYLQTCFADQLKVNVMSKYNIPVKDIFETKTQDTRLLLQKEGTELGRRVDQDVWIKYLDNWITVYHSRGIEVFIISDVRFRNEFQYILSKCGIMIKVTAPYRNKKRLWEESKGCWVTYDEIKNHTSECDLDEIQDNVYDMVINNDPLDTHTHHRNTLTPPRLEPDSSALPTRPKGEARRESDTRTEGPIERSDTEEKLLKILEIKKNKLPTKVIEF